MLVHSPGFTMVAVLTLALGIGANTAIFSIVNAVLLRPLAYKDSPSLVNIWGKFEKDGILQNWISEPEYWDLLAHNESFSEIAAYSLGGRANLTRADAQPVQVSTGNATAGVLPLLGIAPVLGRSFSPEEDQPGHSHYVLLSYELWQSQFGGDASIVEAIAESGRLTGIQGAELFGGEILEVRHLRQLPIVGHHGRSIR